MNMKSLDNISWRVVLLHIAAFLCIQVDVLAINNIDLSNIVGLDAEHLAIKDDSELRNFKEDVLWAIEIKGKEANHIYPIGIIAYRSGTLFNDELWLKYNEAIVKQQELSSRYATLHKIELTNAKGLGGIIAFGPDYVQHSSLLSLPSHGIELRLVVGYTTNSAQLKSADWNESYLDLISSDQGINKYLLEVAKLFSDMPSDSLKSYMANSQSEDEKTNELKSYKKHIEAQGHSSKSNNTVARENDNPNYVGITVFILCIMLILAFVYFKIIK